MDKNTETLVRDALKSIHSIDHILGLAASGGARSKPTVAQLNEIVTKIDDAKMRLRAALQDRDA